MDSPGHLVIGQVRSSYSVTKHRRPVSLSHRVFRYDKLLPILARGGSRREYRPS